MITGIGGIFFKARDIHALSAWYREHLGLPLGEDGHTTFRWSESGPGGSTTFAIVPADTSYFAPGDASFMLNLRVDNLDAVLDRLRSLGDLVAEQVVEEAPGRFGWVVEPEGNRIELWEPAPGH